MRIVNIRIIFLLHSVSTIIGRLEELKNSKTLQAVYQMISHTCNQLTMLLIKGTVHLSSALFGATIFVLGGFYFECCLDFLFFLRKTGKRQRPNFFLHRKIQLICIALRFFQLPMTSSPYPVNVNRRIFKFQKTCHVTHQSTPKTLQSSFIALLYSLSRVVSVKVKAFKKSTIGKIH